MYFFFQSPSCLRAFVVKSASLVSAVPWFFEAVSVVGKMRLVLRHKSLICGVLFIIEAERQEGILKASKTFPNCAIVRAAGIL
jgi:hypothetical protein